MSKLKRFILLSVAAACLGAVTAGWLFLRTKYVVPILMYHQINPWTSAGNGLVVSPSAFEKQLRFLKAHRYNIVTLEEIADLLKNKKKIPPKTVALTFDDGYEDNYIYAFPLLKKYQVPATVFIIVREVGRARGDRLSWEQLRIMQESGLVAAGSHSMGPDPLYKIKSEEALRRELFDSKKALEEKLGVPVRAFSYPEGFFTAHIRALVIEAGYAVAVATKPGRTYPNDDIFALKRLRISENCRDMTAFRWVISGYYTFIKELMAHKRK